MRKKILVTGYLLGLALTLAGLPSSAAAQAAAPKGNGKIAFVLHGNSSASGIWVMNPDGSERMQLTSNRADALGFNPTWSPDGSQIAFMRWVNPGAWQSELFLVNADGSNQRRLIQIGPALWMKPAWSPDGSKISFTGWSGGSAGFLYVINADGSGLRSIGTGWDPDWSPDGTRLVVIDGGLYIVNADGGGRAQLTAPGNPSPNYFDYDWSPIWSPDGRRIIFNRSVNCEFGGDCGSTTIWKIKADGSNLAMLADIWAGNLDWSPDGTKIVFPVAANNGADLFVMNAFGGAITNITNSVGLGETAPSWQPVNLNVPPGINPIDDPEFFVRQHYLDFLGREPDGTGLAFWISEITSCGSDPGCREVKLINVSAAFFLSIEFQNTGYLVERIYKAAYGDATDSSTGLAVPVVRRTELAADSALLGQGVVVNSPGWEQQLEANKRAYASAFVGRQRFADAYPPSMTPAAYVAKLNENAGRPLTQAEADALVAELAADQTVGGRASVLRKVAENAEVVRRERNRAFVLMQYFGYLRRNPDDPPDSNFAGYNFWLQKLEQFRGDFVQAEMVKAFIVSLEYRRRFDQP